MYKTREQATLHCPVCVLKAVWNEKANNSRSVCKCACVHMCMLHYWTRHNGKHWAT